MNNFSKIDKRNIGLIGIGLVPGVLYALNISAESVMLAPFFSGFKYFEILVGIAVILGFVIVIFVLISRSNIIDLKFRIICALGSVFTSFAAGLIFGLAINRGQDILLIIVGLIALFISFELTIPSFESSW